MTESPPLDIESRLKWLEGEVSRLHHRVVDLQGHNLERLNSWRRDLIQMTNAGRKDLSAFNGQVSKLECFHSLFSTAPRRISIETGTYLGWTTRFLAEQFEHVITFETDNRFREQALEFCGDRRNVSFVHGDSAKMIEAWTDIQADLSAVDFAYLDAHWYDHCPLREELGFLLENARNAVIFVDDFQVQDDDSYGYDIYESLAMTLNAIADVVGPRDVSLFYPARPGVWDTSIFDAHQKPRGTLIIVPRGIEAKVVSSSMLRPVPSTFLSRCS